MATSIPAALKTADVQRFVQRANQLEKAKPIISYWCNYWALNHIVPQKLHLLNDDTTTFTSDLMDKLEKAKTEIIDDAISDDTVAQVYVEQFALETFQRADDAMRANSVTRQTADTFSAAATFIDVCKTWAPLNDELAAKAKFAKFHALRIAKALQAGEDPNASNPAPEPASGEDVEMLDQPTEGTLQQPYIEEVPDEHDSMEPDIARRSTIGQSLHPSQAPSTQSPPVENYYQNTNTEVSPLISPAQDLSRSPGKDFFPHATSTDAASLPSKSPAASSPNVSNADAFSSFPPPDIATDQPLSDAPAPPLSVPQQPTAPRYPTRQVAPPRQPQPAPRAPPSRSQPPPPQTYHNDGVYRTDDDSVLEATRHARFAVSALNFEDVRTAVKELQLALNTLGAR